MYLWFIIGATALVFLAMIVQLAGDFKYAARITRILMFTAVIGGLAVYGSSYAYLYPHNPLLAIIRSVLAVCGMFVGKNEYSTVNSAPLFSSIIFQIVFWILHVFALYVTASAAITTIGKEALKNLRVFLSRRGDLNIIYGINENSVAFGRRLEENKLGSVVYVDSSPDASLANTIDSFGGVVRSDSSALSGGKAFARSTGIRAGGKKINVYVMDRDKQYGIRFAEEFLDTLENIGLDRASSSLMMMGDENPVIRGLLGIGDKYGYGNVGIMNEAELAARILIKYYPPCDFIRFDENAKATENFEVLLVGFGKLGQAVLKELVKNGQFSGSVFKADVFDPKLSDVSGSFTAAYPGLFDNYDIELHQADARSVEFYRFLRENSGTLKYVVICVGSGKTESDICTEIESYLRNIGSTAKIFDCNYREIRQVNAGAKEINRHNIYDTSILCNNAMDKMAAALNHAYLGDPDVSPEEAWAGCGYFSRMSSRASADFSESMIKISGSSEEKILENGWNLTPLQRENLGITEHMRWCAFHYTMGYSAMPEDVFRKRAEQYARELKENGSSSLRISKDAVKRQHACLIPWEKLDDLSREENLYTGGNTDYKLSDIKNVEMIPSLLEIKHGSEKRNRA